MIRNCPHCGHSLKKWLRDGISSCENCNRIFDSGDCHTLLAATWTARRTHVDSVEKLGLSLSEIQAEFVQSFVVEGGNSHDEVLKILERLEVDCVKI